MRASLLVAVFVLAGLRVASASCGSPHTALSPPSGARLPPHPTIYLFDTDHEVNVLDALEVTRVGDANEKIRFHAVQLATSADYTVHRLELWYASPRDGEIRVSWHGKPLATYMIGDDGEPDHAAVTDVDHHTHRWMCSFEDVIRIAVEGNAIAYQIQWDDDRTTVLADAHLVWSDAPRTDAELELGHPDCMAYNVASDQLAIAHTFELYALFADGRVKRLGSSIAQLDPQHVRLPVELIRGADVRLPRRFDVAVTTSPHWVFACAGTGGLAGGIVVVLVGRRRRREADAERLAPARHVR